MKAEDNSTQTYTVTVTVAPNTAKSITAFDFGALNVTGTVNEAAKTVALTVPYGTDVTNLVPTITHTGVSISPNSGVAQNYSSPVTYTVKAEDNSIQTYTVTVTIQARVAAPTANPPSGTVASGTTVTLTSATPGALIHYTMDGSTPTASSPVYSAPISITSARTIKAIAVKAGMADSPILTASYTIATVPTPPSSPAPTTQTPTTQIPTTGDVDVIVNGKVEKAGTSSTSQQGGQSVTTIVIDEKKLEQRLQTEGSGAVITIPVNTGSDVVVGKLNGQMVKNMESKQAVMEIRTGNATYTLPAKQININDLSKQLGSNVELQNISISIEIAKPNADTLKIVQQAASNGNFTLVVPALQFTVRATYGNQTVEVSKFNSYVERTIAIPDGIDPNKITTGIVVEPDGTVRHVPTKVVKIANSYFAKINSLTNSTYAVVWHPLTFSDVVTHWAKDAINDMGSRMVVTGFEDGTYKPNQNMTRAEFAAIIVRGLGLRLESGKVKFSDIQANEWYTNAVQTASAYDLINGFEDGKFRPNDKITREQAMVIISRAMRISGLQDKTQGQGAREQIREFADADAISAWAANSVSSALQAGIVTGRNGKVLDPQAPVTRAEVAVMVRNLLRSSGLI
ncbi:Endo-1,4-beta-xylanase A precursor [compost metagenome]